MGFSNNTSGGHRPMTRQEIIDRLAGVDFQAAAENIAYREI